MTGLLPLEFRAPVLRFEVRETSDEEYLAARESVLRRDDHACRYCGFRCTGQTGYMQVDHTDDDHTNNDQGNLVAACAHCHAFRHPDRMAEKDAATLVWLPEVSQAALSGLARVCLVATHHSAAMPAFGDRRGPGQADPDATRSFVLAAEKVMSAVRGRAREVERRLGTHDPGVLVSAMRSCPTRPEGPVASHLLSSCRMILDPFVPFGAKAEERILRTVRYWLSPDGAFHAHGPGTW